jgi:hypothetical protein
VVDDVDLVGPTTTVLSSCCNTPVATSNSTTSPKEEELLGAVVVVVLLLLLVFGNKGGKLNSNWAKVSGPSSMSIGEIEWIGAVG